MQETENQRFIRACEELVSRGLIRSLSSLAVKYGFSKQYFTDLKGKDINYSRKFLDLIARDYPIDKEFVLLGEKKEREESMPAHTNNRIRNEVHLKEYPAHVEVKVVTTKARAGYMDAYYADEYLEEMPTIIVQTDREYSGKYLAFEVDGDSMEPAFNKGNIITGREIRRDLWRSKLHIHDNFFIIAHNTEGILIKQILEHNVETGDILCHSLNDFYNDFTINLRDVSYLFNVIDKREGRDSLKRFLL